MTEAEKLAILERIQRKTQEGFFYVTDKQEHGVEELWDIIPEDYKLGDHYRGDCDEFSMICRKLCRDHGINNARLVLCTYREKQGRFSVGKPIGHLVTEVDGYIFDVNKQELSRKYALEQLGYEWYSISGTEPGDQWYKLLDS